MFCSFTYVVSFFFLPVFFRKMGVRVAFNAESLT